MFVYNVAIDYEPINSFNFLIDYNTNKNIKPLIVGFGPAGIFAAYIFVLNGIKPIIIERGKKIEERIIDTKNFLDNLILNENSNVCFGEGGAGAFSDGKLNTNNKDKNGIYKFVLETFVKFGADENILYENLPHIGTDRLIEIIKNMRNFILSNGGEIRYNEIFTYQKYKHYAKENPIILAVGNSSRDTFRDLYENGFDIKAKTIAVGYRIAHKQNKINEIQYGKNKNINILGNATYKLIYNCCKDRAVYSFCMCPGGYIINSSNYNGFLSINGMSYHSRDGEYANSAIVETVSPSNIIGDIKNPLITLEFQEKVEKKAFEIFKGYIPYYYGGNDKINLSNIFKGQAKFCENLKNIYENTGLNFNINEDIEKALNYFDNKMKGFLNNEIILAGVETRTSSPIMLLRNENYKCNIDNYYPCGEGLGHGGGILSCASDGVKVAMKVMKNYKK